MRHSRQFLWRAAVVITFLSFGIFFLQPVYLACPSHETRSSVEKFISVRGRSEKASVSRLFIFRAILRIAVCNRRAFVLPRLRRDGEANDLFLSKLPSVVHLKCQRNSRRRGSGVSYLGERGVGLTLSSSSPLYYFWTCTLYHIFIAM